MRKYKKNLNTKKFSFFQGVKLKTPLILKLYHLLCNKIPSALQNSPVLNSKSFTVINNSICISVMKKMKTGRKNQLGPNREWI